MPKDYKNRASAGSREGGKSPCWVWFVSGILVGLFCAGLAWLKLAPVGQSGPNTSARDTAANTGNRRQGERKKPTTPAPRFDFYTLLPEMEVVIPEPELRSPPARIVKPSEPRSAKRQKSAYLLQMGSFRRQADAERMKVRLLLLDIAAEIQKVTINNKDTFHRVRSGPYHDSGHLEEIQARLRKNNIQSMALRVKR